jgi:hypothetical protein
MEERITALNEKYAALEKRVADIEAQLLRAPVFAAGPLGIRYASVVNRPPYEASDKLRGNDSAPEDEPTSVGLIAPK